MSGEEQCFVDPDIANGHGATTCCGVAVEQFFEATVDAERSAHSAGNDRQLLSWVATLSALEVDERRPWIVEREQNVLAEEVAMHEARRRRVRQRAPSEQQRVGDDRVLAVMLLELGDRFEGNLASRRRSWCLDVESVNRRRKLPDNSPGALATIATHLERRTAHGFLDEDWCVSFDEESEWTSDAKRQLAA